MKKNILAAIMILLSIGAVAQEVKSVKTADLKKDFKLLPAEVPAGFVIRPINAEAREVGFTSNPGSITSKAFIKSIYPNVNTNAVSNLTALMYMKPRTEQELGAYLIEYKSTSFLDIESRKIRAVRGSRYFKKDNYLLIVWSDAGSFIPQVNVVAAKLKNRLKLNEFKPIPEDLSSITDTVVN